MGFRLGQVLEAEVSSNSLKALTTRTQYFA